MVISIAMLNYQRVYKLHIWFYFIHEWGYPNRRMNGLFHGESHKQKKGGVGDKTVGNGQNLVVSQRNCMGPTFRE